MSKGAGKPPDYEGAARAQADASRANNREQIQANRPDQTNAFGANVSWQQGPDGSWRQVSSLGGPLGDANQALQQQALFSLGQPMDFGQFGELGTGDSARDQAINAAYSQATSRLNPAFEQRETQLRSRLANQGLDPNSEAARNAMQQFGFERNDAFGSAMNSAIAQGTAAGDSVFRNNLMSRQQAMAEALRKRTQPLSELGALQGFTGQQGFMGAGQAQAPDLLGAAGLLGNYNLQNKQISNSGWADAIGGLGQLAGSGASLATLSDERAKQNVERLPVDALPGVPFAAWEYRAGYGPPGRRLGVIAQDLEAVAPEFVATREDGLKMVDYSFLLEAEPWTS